MHYLERLKPYKGLIAGILIFMALWVLAHRHAGFYEWFFGDGLVQFFPGIVHNGREFFSGHIPMVNYHQFLGYESLLTGYYGGFYLPTYLSYGVAHFIFGNDFLTMECLMFFHYLMGLTGFYVLLKQYTRGQFLPFLSAISYVFSAIYLNYATEWWYALLPMAFLPWITYFLLRIIKGFVAEHYDIHQLKKEMVLLGLFFVVLVCGGNSHFTLFTIFYTALLALFLVLVRFRSMRWSRFRKSWRLIFSLIFCALLLFYLAEQGQMGIHKQVQNFWQYMIGIKLDFSIWKFFLTPLFDHGQAFSGKLLDNRGLPFETAYLAPIGIFNGVGVLLLILFIVSKKWWPNCESLRKAELDMRSFLLVGILGLFLALGLPFVYKILAHIDPLSRLFHVFKHYFFSAFYLSFAGGVMMILFLDYLPWKGKKLVRYGMIGLSIVVLFFHVNVITEITSWLFDRSPRPFEIIQDLPMERTYVTVGTDRYKEDGQELCAVAGAYSCASLMGSYYYGGYEPLLPLPYKDVFHGGLFSFESTYTGVNQKLHKRLRAMGVCDYIVTKGYGPPQALARNWGRDITDFQVNESFAKEFYLLQDTDCQGTYTEVGQIESLVRHGQGIDIELRGIDQDTVLHLKQYYLDRYRFLSQDGVPLEFTVDEDYRMMDIVLPKGTTSIHVVYHHPVLQWIFYLSLLSFMVLGWTMGSYFYDEYRRALPHEKA